MENIKKENRRESYEDITGKKLTRQRLCMEILHELGGKATANEIAYEMYERKLIPFYDTNYAKPRLNELEAKGYLEVIGKKKDRFSGKSCSIYSIVEITRTLKCHRCGAAANQVSDPELEARGFYAFDCDCGEEFFAPYNNPDIKITKKPTNKSFILQKLL